MSIYKLDKKLNNLLELAIRDTRPLVEMAAQHHSKFLNVLLGILRVSFSTMRDIYYLSSYEGTGASMLDLARKIIEHGISIEYMLLKGKEQMAKCFQNYIWVQMNNELEFLKSIGRDPASLSDELNLKVERAEKKYDDLTSKTKKARTWAGVSIAQMFKSLYDNRILNNFDRSRVGQAYVWGCRLNHPNPFVVRNYLKQEDDRIADEYHRRQAIFMSIVFHLKLTTRYIDEIRILSKVDVHEDIADKVDAIYKEINTLNP